jgi:hypothetical protein
LPFIANCLNSASIDMFSAPLLRRKVCAMRDAGAG